MDYNSTKDVRIRRAQTMKKIILIIFMVLFFLTGHGFSSDRDRYDSSSHKFRSQFNDNEWREHEARSEEYFRARHPEYYLYREDRHHHRHKRDYYRYKDSLEYDDIYDEWWDESHGYDWENYDEDLEGEYDWKDRNRNKHRQRWD
jgi:hypothetical protein